MKALRLLALLAVCCATSTMVGGVMTTASAAEAEPAKPVAPASKAADQAAAAKQAEQSERSQASSQPSQGTHAQQDEPPVKEQPAEAPAQTNAQKSGKAVSAKGSPDRFVPSEQVRADFDVSFPIDI